MQLINVTPPAVEPISVAQARLHLRELTPNTAGTTDIDDKIGLAIQTGRELCENDCRRALITQQWKLRFDEFPAPSMNISAATWYGPQWGTAPGPLQSVLPSGTSGYEIYLPLPPLQSVDSITYYDQDGTQQTMNVGTDIALDKVSEPSRILPAIGTSWPYTQRHAGGIEITFTCGYGSSAAAVPACAKSWILTQLGTLYELRQAELVVYRETLVVPTFVERLLDPIRVRRY